MSQRKSSLQAALAGAAEAEPAKPATKKRTTAGQGRAAKTSVARKPAKQAADTSKEKAKRAAARENTVLVGGHFPQHVSRQLKMIAAEEDTTNQALIAEALDLLFTRKGKGKIADLPVG